MLAQHSPTEPPKHKKPYLKSVLTRVYFVFLCVLSRHWAVKSSTHPRVLTKKTNETESAREMGTKAVARRVPVTQEIWSDLGRQDTQQKESCDSQWSLLLVD